MENEPCPACNFPMVEFYLGWKCPTDNCGFRCSKNSLPRIAAAMGLARAGAAQNKAYQHTRTAWRISDSEGDLADDKLHEANVTTQEAFKRVVEV